MNVKRCEECGEIITDDMDFKEGFDLSELCEACNDERPENL